MALNGAVRSAIHCNGCRHAVVSSFASIAGLEVRISALKASTAIFTTGNKSRSFSQLSTSRHLQPSSGSAEDTLNSSTSLRDDQNALNTSNDGAIPWYLRVKQPDITQDSQNPMSARQEIPTLPENSPPILPELLNYVSIDLGLDDLKLLDLRSLDPPPALGSNLLMLVGTTRSEKHLNVSADKFCRWLRSNHKLRPHAAGLLGRNELKLKLKRRAKRMRLMANVGAEEPAEFDDGIRTGWICVTVGSVAAAESAPSSVPRAQDFVGFNEQQEGVNIVVQMFTEEKRAEIDLEGLWENIMQRKMRQAKEDGQVAEIETAPKVASGQALPVSTFDTLKSPNITGHTPFPAVSVSSTLEQLRHLRISSSGTSRAAKPSITTSNIPNQRSSRSRFHSSAIGRNIVASQTCIDGSEELIMLRSKISELYNMSTNDALSALGKDFRDRTSSGFLQTFYETFPETPEIDHWEAVMDLWDYAATLGHSGYPRSAILKLKAEIEASGVVLSSQIYMQMLKTLLTPVRANDAMGIPQENMENAMTMLSEMHGLGYDAVSEEIMLLMSSAAYLAPAGKESNDQSPGKAAEEMPSVTSRLLWLLSQMHPGLGSDVIYHNLLVLSARDDDWLGFWDTWHFMPRAMYRRSPFLYRTALDCASNTGNQTLCAMALRECMADMDRETPSVAFAGDLVESVLRCISVISPDVSEASQPGDVDIEWIRLYKKCQAALRRSGGEKRSESALRDSAPVPEHDMPINGLSYA